MFICLLKLLNAILQPRSLHQSPPTYGVKIRIEDWWLGWNSTGIMQASLTEKWKEANALPDPLLSLGFLFDRRFSQKSRNKQDRSLSVGLLPDWVVQHIMPVGHCFAGSIAVWDALFFPHHIRLLASFAALHFSPFSPSPLSHKLN